MTTPLVRSAVVSVVLALTACGGDVGVDPGPPDSGGPVLPVGGQVAQLVSNGSFETGTVTAGAVGGARAPAPSKVHAHSGEYALHAGADTVQVAGNAFATQTLHIPASATRATLSFWYWASSSDVLAHDWQDAQVRDTRGNLLLNVFHQLSNAQEWTQQQVDLTAFRGSTVVLYFNVHTDDVNPTSMWIDDVSLEVLLPDGADAGSADAGPEDAGPADAGPAETVVLASGVPVAGLSGAAGSDAFFALTVPANATDVRFTLGTGTSSTNDAELYVRLGSAPTPSAYDCRSWNVGLSESCTFSPAQPGTYYALVRGASAFTDATLTASYTLAATSDAGPVDAGASDAGASDAGPVDAGPVDAGPVDAGPVDAGPSDAGVGPGAALSVHTTLGLPDDSATSLSSPDRYLSVKRQYVLSYNSSRKVPNWVSWELSPSWLGGQSRTDTFRPDDTLPASLPQASLADYQEPVYDRGHMCPSADRTLDFTDNSATFYLTNMVPQSGNNNQGPWARLEDYSRTLVTGSGKRLFVLSGGIFAGTPKSIGAGVSVPSDTWKVITVLDGPGQGVASVTTSTRVIAVIMPNDDALISQSADWHNYRVSVDQIELATGLDVMSEVPAAIQEVIEARVDTVP